jgi:peroxiredoxin
MKSGDAATVADYQKEHKLQFPTIIDPYNHLAQQLSIKGTPSLFIINRQGHVLYYSMGASSAIGLRLKLFIIEHIFYIERA